MPARSSARSMPLVPSTEMPPSMPKARVVGLGCQLHALRNLHQRTQSHRFPLRVALAHLLNLLANHPARDQIDGSLADWHLQTGLGDASHTHAAADGNARRSLTLRVTNT